MKSTLILSSSFKECLVKPNSLEELKKKGINKLDDLEKSIITIINKTYNIYEVKKISYLDLSSDTYIGFIVDEFFVKMRYVCIIPPLLGTRSGFIAQQLFGFVSNLILNSNLKSASLSDLPITVINTEVADLTDSKKLSIACLHQMEIDYIDIYSRGDKIYDITSLNDFIYWNNKISKNKDFNIEKKYLVFNTNRLKGLDSNLTNEPYYYAIKAYPAVKLAIKDGIHIDVTAFDNWYDNVRNNKNIEAFYVYAKKMQSSMTNAQYKITSSQKAYIAAIQTKPFLLLAGISGTGKSRIVREFAFMTCPKALQDKDGTTPGNFCLIEVKPNWHDSTDLFGYYSSIQGKYVYTPFIKFLIKAKMYPNVPFFVCLDEMNLAPVEQYFAEFLSELESRKLNGDNIVTGPLVKSDNFKSYSYIKDSACHLLTSEGLTDGRWNELLNYDGSYDEMTKEAIDKKAKDGKTLQEIGLTLPENVIIIGTVNMDDTTYKFSRKVIDRAMTIEMNGGKLHEMFGKSSKLTYRNEDDINEDKRPFPLSVFKAIYVTADDAVEKCENMQAYLNSVIGSEDEPDTLSGRLKAINNCLEGTPFQVSYRVLNELVIYLAVLLDMELGDVTKEKFNTLMNKAIDEIMVMKILPRIEGDDEMFECRGYKGERLQENKLDLLIKLAPQFKETIPVQGEDGMKSIKEILVDGRALTKLKEMKARLKRSSFTRFWP